MAKDQNPDITAVVQQERSRLLGFIQQRVADTRDAEDILQDVFFRLVEANRLLMPINRIIDGFRKRRPELFSDAAEEDEWLLEDMLPSSEDGPEAAYARQMLLAQLTQAIEELPAEQRAVFVGHELEGRTFKEMAAESHESINTLLSRKRYAVLYLRQRLQATYDDYTKE